MWIYSKYITLKSGKRIYRANGKVFRFWIDDDKLTNIDVTTKEK